MELLLWLEETRLATFVRESNSILAYPTFLFVHTLGLATVAGLSAFLNLRVFGYARNLPLAALSPYIVAIWVGFALTAVSGTALFLADASTKTQMPIFYAKLVFIALALVSVHQLTKRFVRDPLADHTPLPRQAHLLAAASLLCWIGATTAGRLLAYVPAGSLF
jgi:hypothetical protein